MVSERKKSVGADVSMTSARKKFNICHFKIKRGMKVIGHLRVNSLLLGGISVIFPII